MTRRRMSALILACLLVLMTGCANHNTAKESGTETESNTKTNINAEENTPTANTPGADSGSPVTIKIAN